MPRINEPTGTALLWRCNVCKKTQDGQRYAIDKRQVCFTCRMRYEKERHYKHNYRGQTGTLPDRDSMDLFYAIWERYHGELWAFEELGVVVDWPWERVLNCFNWLRSNPHITGFEVVKRGGFYQLKSWSK